MPIDKQVIARHKILDRLFRHSEGYTYDELIAELEENDIYVSERTIKADKKFFEENYDAVFCEGLKRGKQSLFRYENTGQSAFATKLSEEEKGIIGKLIERLQLHDDIPQYQWTKFLLDELRLTDDLDFADYVEFENNIWLNGIEHFKPLLEACMGKYVISFLYSSFKNTGEPKVHVVSPYLIQQFNNRWFLICSEKNLKNLSTFAFDRIVENSIKKEPDIEFKDTDRSYIGTCLNNNVGVTNIFDKRNKTDHILLSVDKNRYHYLRTKPLPGQEEVEEGSTDRRQLIRLNDITANKELISLILSFGPDMEVLEPAGLREEIAMKVKSMAELYSD